MNCQHEQHELPASVSTFGLQNLSHNPSPDPTCLVPFFPAATFNPSIRCVRVEVGGQMVEESGPLACCHHFMDTAARRVLPGHLLRRCRVLSSVQLGDTCQMRVALTARTGEEAVFIWRLRWAAEDAAAATAAADAAAVVGSLRAATASSRSEYEGAQAGGCQQHQHQQQRQTQTTQPSTLQCSGDSSQQQRSAASPSSHLGPTADPIADSERGLDQPEAASSSAATTLYTATDSCTSSCSCNSSGSNSAGDLYGRNAKGGRRQASGSLPFELFSLKSPVGATTSGSGVYDSVGSGGGSYGQAADRRQPQQQLLQHGVTTWIVESIRRDDSHDEEEMPSPSPLGRGPHPRCSPEQLVKAQLAALRRGDLTGAASFNLWSRSTSGGWDLHLSAFKAMLRQPSYHVLLTSDGAELGPSALLSGRRMVQEVRLLSSKGGGSGGSGSSSVTYQLCMQASGCWLVEGIRTMQ
ncbi:hypothetical protein Vretimale_8276 [Volvox reticuliferus]|uniref:Uncharacterized protein n=1 Tax=Volvox reticuliferus TaxID=1737510 RepID=A0A8J4GAI2_9CHLO|nr:hypothetical protein Vretimale_8276 [Volvox reticuliferus]